MTALSIRKDYAIIVQQAGMKKDETAGQPVIIIIEVEYLKN
jgi:hypothetical protein